MKRYDLELTATGMVMEEREQGAFVSFSEVSGLADTVMKMGGRCTLLADLLLEVAKIVPAIGVAIDDLPVVDAFLERIENALAGQEPWHSSNDTLAMMMDELHDICVGLDTPGGAQNGAEAWEQVKGARDRVLASLNHGRPDTEWTDATASPVADDYRELQERHDQLQSRLKVALDLLQESHEVMRRIIPPLPQDCANRSDLLDRIEVALAGKFSLPAWYLDGAKDFKSMMLDASTALFHPHIEGVFAVFERRLALDGKPQGGEPCAIASPSSSQA
ncbi:hypothetical protein EHZ47_02045 [Aeromonas jandaei]|uniref:hypothetical protein n=1 Tax=Aeromonas jandaei TaxID=650 RepID=UPI000F548AED|nr:hypothetical protein [Aeromonas jandaei]RQM78898.1 hypothetical protein EHZ47_02045 [Aeromonas jandaei]